MSWENYHLRIRMPLKLMKQTSKVTETLIQAKKVPWKKLTLKVRQKDKKDYEIRSRYYDFSSIIM